MKYTAGELIGKGSFGKVFRGRATALNAHGEPEQVAIKRIPKASLKSAQEVGWLKQEIAIMGKLKNSLNVIHFHEAFEDDMYVYMVMELCQGGDLVHRILKGSVFAEEDAKPYMVSARAAAGLPKAFRRKGLRARPLGPRGASRALGPPGPRGGRLTRGGRRQADILRLAEQCHYQKVIHRDIKPDNFLLASKSKRSVLKMIDFGLSEPWKGKHLSDATGTPLFMAPEVILGRYGLEADLWSCGCMLYYLLAGRTPFEPADGRNIKIRELVQSIKYGRIDVSSEPWPQISPEAKDLLLALLERNPKKRLTAAKALKHPWFKSYFTRQDSEKSALQNSMVQRMQHSGSFNKLKKKGISQYLLRMADEEVKEIRDLFAKMDTDGDGSITPKEMLDGLKANGYFLNENETMWMMQQLDSDGDGLICPSEFVTALLDVRQVTKCRNFQTFIASMFKKLDADGDGYVTRKEIAGYFDSMSKEEMNAILDDGDRDHDGRLTLAEFKAMMEESVRTFERFDPRLEGRYVDKPPAVDLRRLHSVDRRYSAEHRGTGAFEPQSPIAESPQPELSVRSSQALAC